MSELALEYKLADGGWFYANTFPEVTPESLSARNRPRRADLDATSKGRIQGPRNHDPAHRYHGRDVEGAEAGSGEEGRTEMSESPEMKVRDQVLPLLCKRKDLDDLQKMNLAFNLGVAAVAAADGDVSLMNEIVKALKRPTSFQ